MIEELSKSTITQTTSMLKLLGDATRFRMLHLLEDKEWSVNAIAEELKMEQSAVSHQLKKLKDAKLVKSKRVGKQMLYSQDDHHVYEILHMAISHVEHSKN